jgi:hypothetical protein
VVLVDGLSVVPPPSTFELTMPSLFTLALVTLPIVELSGAPPPFMLALTMSLKFTEDPLDEGRCTTGDFRFSEGPFCCLFP